MRDVCEVMSHSQICLGATGVVPRDMPRDMPRGNCLDACLDAMPKW